MTLGHQWSWKPDDQLKSFPECIRTLIATVGGDGNLLLNVGPMPDGRIAPQQADLLRKMGDWLQEYGEGIYGTRGGPFRPGDWGASTCKENSIYLFITSWPGEATLTSPTKSPFSLRLPALNASIVQSQTLSGGEVAVHQDDSGITITSTQRDPVATVIRLTVDTAATEIAIPSPSTP